LEDRALASGLLAQFVQLSPCGIDGWSLGSIPVPAMGVLRDDRRIGGSVLETGKIGRRVRYWRERRGMTRKHFGDLVGRSASWVDKIESGERKLDRLSLLEQIAEALGVSPNVLVDDEQSRLVAQCPDPVEIAAIRAALQRYESLAPVRNAHSGTAGPDLRRLQQQVAYAWSAFQASDYASLGPILGGLLIDGQRAVNEFADDHSTETARVLLAQTYQITASTVRKLGRYEMEWLAADRGIALAAQTTDPVLLGGAAFRLVNAVLDNDGAREAVAVARGVADRLEGTLTSGRPEHWSIFGHVLLQGAVAAAVAHEPSNARDLLDEAESAAERLGEDRNDYWTAFGPTNVTIHRVSAMVELREPEAAIAASERIDPTQMSGLPRERRAHHLIDVARANSLRGRRDEAVTALLDADNVAPREVRCRPAARSLVVNLVERARGRPSLALQQLARHVGLAV
jgi:transcriptional regulator with XRE-family HTH domain